ncbi:right-handed parallel beta-helix repeat-containing protein [Sorangium sp. So ce726]|uniref:right-handed parallel beta-helix repeat-containing protein n=1 Tax=Sorangium sp. So ce726 TaxID=3133319 RepID=UPI003F5F05F3
MHPPCLSVRHLLCCRSALALLALAFTTAGCGADDRAPVPPDPGPTEACAPGEMPLDGGGCQPAGLPPGHTAGLPPDMPCAPGEMPLDGGGCQPAGVPPEACGQSFGPDGRGGCTPILPEDTCPPGRMAAPGDTRCYEVAPCGSGDYGSIPVEATTQFVNGAYPGSDSDGTGARPWKRIQEGIDHAATGAIVAVAAGTYAEDILIQRRPVRLWGRCPGLVEVVGTGAELATVLILGRSANASEIHAIAITGASIGIGTSGAIDTVIDRVWIHDTQGRGIDSASDLGTTTFTVFGSLIEAATDIGVTLFATEATIEATVVRDTQPNVDGMFGRGIQVEHSDHRRSALTLRTTLLERNHDAGMVVLGSDATIEATVVRDTQPRQSDALHGYGISIEYDHATRERSDVTLHSSFLEGNHVHGVAVHGSDATIEATVVRDTRENGDGTSGAGVAIQDDGERASVALRSSLLEQNRGIGMIVRGSDATVEATVVRGTQPTSDGTNGHGVVVQDDLDTHERANMTLRSSLVIENHDVGVFVSASDAAIEGTVVRDTQPQLDGSRGYGIAADWADVEAQSRATLALRASLVDRNHSAGVLVLGSDATIESTVVRDTQPLRTDGVSGHGLAVQDLHERANVTLRSSLIERNHDAGVLLVGSDATVEATVVRDTQPRRGKGIAGRGIALDRNLTTHERASVTVRASILERNRDMGISVSSSDATIETTIIRDTESRESDGLAGYGILVENITETRDPASVALRGCRLEQNHMAGMVVFDSDATVEDTVVSETQPVSDERGGYGIYVEDDPATDERAGMTLRRSLVERNHIAGVIAFSSDATVETAVVHDTRPNRRDGTFGDGIVLISREGPSAATITSTHVESNARAGVANFSAQVLLTSSTVQCNRIDLVGESFLADQPFSFDGSTGNICGCGDTPEPTCPVLGALLSPPEPIHPVEPR